MSFPVSLASSLSISGTQPLFMGSHGTGVHVQDRNDIIALGRKLGLGTTNAVASGTTALLGTGGTQSAWGQLVNAYIAANAAIDVSKLGSAPFCNIFSTINQNIPNATWTAVNFESEFSDALGWHGTASPHLITISEAGVYLFMLAIVYLINSNGARYFSFTGASQVSNLLVPNVTNTNDPDKYYHFGVQRIGTVPQNVYISTYQTSGGTLALNNAWVSQFAVVKIGN